MDTERHNTDELPVRFPGVLSLKDLITMVSVAVSLTIAWGVFGTRLTLNERQLATQERQIAALEQRVNKAEQRLRENEFMVDQLYEYSGKPRPLRRDPY